METGILGVLNQVKNMIVDWKKQIPKSVDVSDVINNTTHTVLSVSGSGYFYSLFLSAIPVSTGDTTNVRFGLVVDGVTLFDNGKPASRHKLESASTISGKIRFNSSLVITVRDVGGVTMVYVLKALYSRDP